MSRHCSGGKNRAEGRTGEHTWGTGGHSPGSWRGLPGTRGLRRTKLGSPGGRPWPRIQLWGRKRHRAVKAVLWS